MDLTHQSKVTEQWDGLKKQDPTIVYVPAGDSASKTSTGSK